MSKTFNIYLEGPSLEFAIDDIWPDGDAPENPTEEDVADAMRNYGFNLIRDWNLDDGLEVWINGLVKV